MALAITAFAYCTAEAQSAPINVCGVKNDKVCKISSNRRTASCYKTQYAENFKVCKGDAGYFICCETPNATNSTNPQLAILGVKPYRGYAALHDNYVPETAMPQADRTAPQSQSYPTNTGFGMTSSYSYEGYYPKKNSIKVCYTGENVAELNRDPYHGCPSPQSEGPEVNNVRNINVSNPVDLPPVSGRPEE